MFEVDEQHSTAEVDLRLARRRAAALAVGSPSWDAMMGLVDDLDRQIDRLDREGAIAEYPPMEGLAAVARP